MNTLTITRPDDWPAIIYGTILGAFGLLSFEAFLAVLYWLYRITL